MLNTITTLVGVVAALAAKEYLIDRPARLQAAADAEETKEGLRAVVSQLRKLEQDVASLVAEQQKVTGINVKPGVPVDR